MMTSSCPRPASPSLAASALGETLIVSSWTRVPRWAWADDRERSENAQARGKQERDRKTRTENCRFPKSELGLRSGCPPSPGVYWNYTFSGKSRRNPRAAMSYEQNSGNEGLTADLRRFGHGISEMLSGLSFGWLKSRSNEHALMMDIAKAPARNIFFFRPSLG